MIDLLGNLTALRRQIINLEGVPISPSVGFIPAILSNLRVGQRKQIVGYEFTGLLDR